MPGQPIEPYRIDGNLLGNGDRYQFPKAFDCGVDTINSYFRSSLKRSLRSENVSGIGAISDAGSVIGFCTLALCSVDRSSLVEALGASSLPAQLSAVRLVMLGVDKRYQGQGVGRRLLGKMFLQALKVHREIPIKGIYLDAAPGAVGFYRQLGFGALQKTDALGSTPMFLSVKVLLRAH